MARKLTWKISLILVLALVACGPGWKRAAYQPRPVAKERVAENFERLWMSAWGVRPIRIEVKDTFALATFVGNGHASTFSLTYSDVKRIDLLTRPGDFSVEMFDAKGESLGWFMYQDRNKAEEMYDTLATLTGVPTKTADPVSTATSM